MKQFIRVIFAGEVVRQCTFALRAVQDMDACLKAMHPDNWGKPGNDIDPRTAMDTFWYATHAFLCAAANVSKILWPETWRAKGSKAREARGVELRQLLQVQSGSVLESRDFRNHFEHFDERIEEWDELTPDHQFFDANFGLARGVDSPGSIFLRNYEPSTHEITFMNESYAVKPIEAELAALLKSAKSLASQPLEDPLTT